MATTMVAVKTMKAAHIPKAGAEFQIVEREIPTPRDGEVRIKVVIPTSDKRLIHAPKLLRKRLSPEQLAGFDAETGKAWRTFYIFLGDVPLNCLRAVEYADAKLREGVSSAET